jgi:phosphatidylserine/phosphatidylglycerophosphate/cardiolipin synthase-like enzyme
MVHVKLMIVDDIFVSVSSGNFDNRSIRLNDEANLDVLDRRFAAQQTRLFENDKKHCREATLDKTGGLISPIRFNRRPGSLLRSCRGACASACR